MSSKLYLDTLGEFSHAGLVPALGSAWRQEASLLLLGEAVLVRLLLPLNDPKRSHQFLGILPHCGERTEQNESQLLLHLDGEVRYGVEVLVEQVPVPGVVVPEPVQLKQQIITRVLEVHEALMGLEQLAVLNPGLGPRHSLRHREDVLEVLLGRGKLTVTQVLLPGVKEN